MAFTIKQSDTSPSLQVTFQDAEGNPVNIVGASIDFYMESLDGILVVDAPMTIVNGQGGIAKYDWQIGDTDSPGTYYAEFKVTYGDGSVETFPNNTNSTIIIYPSLVF